MKSKKLELLNEIVANLKQQLLDMGQKRGSEITRKVRYSLELIKCKSSFNSSAETS